MILRKYAGECAVQFTCPVCKTTGSSCPMATQTPLCHVCQYAVFMLPSHNGVILDDWVQHLENARTECRRYRAAWKKDWRTAK